MNEAQRFLRYVTPGLSFVILIAAYCYFSQHDQTLGFARNFFFNNGIGAAIGLFLTSGGIGFLLSIFHHALFWSCFYDRWATDYREVLKHAVCTGRLELRLLGQEPIAINDRWLSRTGAWRVVSSLWHERRENTPRLKGAHERTVSLSDIMHGAGTGLIGSFAAFLAWLLLDYRHADYYRISFWCVFIAAVFIVWGHWWNLCLTVKHCQGFIGSVLSDELRWKKRYHQEPASVIISRDDLEVESRSCTPS